jgi:hypothetical protein
VELVDQEPAVRDSLEEVGSVDFSGVMRGALLVVDIVGVGSRCVLFVEVAAVTETSNIYSQLRFRLNGY